MSLNSLSGSVRASLLSSFVESCGIKSIQFSTLRLSYT